MSEKSCNFCLNSIINCVYPVRLKNKMNTSLHAVFNGVCGNEYLVIVFTNIDGRKMRFSESSQNSISEKSIFGHFEVISLYV